MESSVFQSKYGTIEYSTEEGTKKALHQLIIFFVYMLCLTVIGDSLSSQPKYNYCRGIETLFYESAYMTNFSQISFKDVMTVPDFWYYMEYVVQPMFHGVVYDTVTPWEPSMVNARPSLYGRMFLNESLILGSPRLRQIRVKEDTCFLNYAFGRYFNTCVGHYSSANEYTEPVYKGTKFKTMQELESTSINAVVHTYSSGGYVQKLTYNKYSSLGIMRHLQNISWLDRASRLVLYEVNMMNLNLYIIQSVKLIFEILPTGLINTKYDSMCIIMDWTEKWYLLVASVLMYAINFYFTFVECKTLYIHGRRQYFARLATYLYLPRIILNYMALIFQIGVYVEENRVDSRINLGEFDFIPLDNVNYVIDMHQDMIAILTFLTWMTLLGFMEFDPVLRTIGTAMQMAATDLGAFTIMFLISFVAFGNLGLLLFGGYNANFKDFPTALMTMVRIIITDFDYFELEAESRVLGPMFFVTYVLLIYFVLLNMFLAVIVLSYRMATTTMVRKPNFLCYVIRKRLYRITNGYIKMPKYPEWEGAHGQHLDADKLQEMRVMRDYSETEQDLAILFRRLDLIEEIFHNITNNMDDVLADARAHGKKTKPLRMKWI